MNETKKQKKPLSEAQKKAMKKYREENEVKKTVYFFKNPDADILEYLEKNKDIPFSRLCKDALRKAARESDK